MSTPGKVYLVGAGPGDPELLTLKGRRALREADVVIYDRLANPELLAHARPEAERIYAGKETRRHTLPQSQVNALLIQHARAGKTVCRLKGGDPFLLGRGGEEAEALARAGIPFEVVPGVSSAIAVPAYAGIPVTHRGMAASVAIVAGQSDADGGPESSRDWDALARADTLVVLMGVEKLPEIVAALLAGGKSPNTPVAMIRWGTYPVQETLCSTLGEIVAQAQATGFRRPAVIVMGEVVRLREPLAWYERRPLFGRRILVTRAPEQAADLVDHIRDAGGVAVETPLIRFAPVVDANLTCLDEPWDWVVFTSANAVRFLLAALRQTDHDVRALGAARLAAIGPATARALDEAGLRVDFTAPRSQAEGLLDTFPEPVTGRRILIPRARQAREVLVQGWQQQGAVVEVLPVYETLPDEAGAARARAELAAGVDAVVFTSGSTVEQFCRAVRGVDLGSAKIVCLGPVTAAAARERGLPVHAVAETQEVAALIPALIRALAEE
ncbi:MAG: uroporphyrinogen-III C-methyltransferase [Armatimonadetes bacterium]|nr:uroporphyrinogen-III C-methyltransferase [Armatimonadota bacterium]